jgi:phenylacetate-CoA ligase
MYQPSISAFQPKESVKILQEQKLRELLQYLDQKSPFYRDLFSRNQLRVEEIHSLEDLSRIPVTNKEDLQERNTDFFCVSRNKIIEYTSTSGTLGSPVTIALTENDLQRLAWNEYSSFQ